MSKIHKHPLFAEFRRQAKQVQNQTGIKKLKKAQEALARAYGFTSLHNLQSHIQKTSDDERLEYIDLWPGQVVLPYNFYSQHLEIILRLRREAQSLGMIWSGAYGQDLMANLHGFKTHKLMAASIRTAEDVFADLRWDIDEEMGEVLSGEIAMTNAYAFTIDGEECVAVTQDRQDPNRAVIQATMSYIGEQDEEKMFHGAEFDVTADIHIKRDSLNDAWELDEIHAMARNEMDRPGMRD